LSYGPGETVATNLPKASPAASRFPRRTIPVQGQGSKLPPDNNYIGTQRRQERRSGRAR
jgi:hypothetical protein